jgi:hydrogenase nickel incorporation protein HypA/HybF
MIGPVHEFSIAEALATQVATYAPATGRIRIVEIRVGALRGLETESLAMCWQAVTGGTPLDGSTLEVEQLPWTLDCGMCGRTWTSPVPFVTCECGNESPAPTAGDELNLVAISYDDAPNEFGVAPNEFGVAPNEFGVAPNEFGVAADEPAVAAQESAIKEPSA